jgi:hypothetical protein
LTSRSRRNRIGKWYSKLRLFIPLQKPRSVESGKSREQHKQQNTDYPRHVQRPFELLFHQASAVSGAVYSPSNGLSLPPRLRRLTLNSRGIGSKQSSSKKYGRLVRLGVSPGQGQGGADSTHDSVTKFAAVHPRFEELSEDIVFFLDTGRANDLAEAYSLAERFK